MSRTASTEGATLPALLLLVLGTLHWSSADPIPLPNFQDLLTFYPGFRHHGGRYNNHHFLRQIGVSRSVFAGLLQHDTSALRMSYALNKIGGAHSLGTQLIRLSKHGKDSVQGRDGFQYIYHPIAYGPYLADKYGYPSVSKLHQLDPLDTKKTFWGKQGILRVITYTKKQNRPKGHVGLWDCNHFHQSKDWIAGHSLITVEFWESPDSDCSKPDLRQLELQQPSLLRSLIPPPRPDLRTLSKKRSWRRHFIKKYYLHKSRENQSLW